MGDPLASEKALAFSEPPVYPSRDYVTVQTSERPTEPGNWWMPGSRFTITIRSPGQNEFMDASKMRLEFSVMVWGTAGRQNLLWREADGEPQKANYLNPQRNPYTCGLPMSTVQDVCCNLPGLPAWGLPYFSAVRVNVPGLPLESFLTAEGESQWQAATRLLASSGTAHIDRDGGPISFGIRGEAEAAGARSALDRATCVSFLRAATDRCRSVGLWRDPVSEAPPAGPTGYDAGFGFGSIPGDYRSANTAWPNLWSDWTAGDAGTNGTQPAGYFSEGDLQLRGVPIHYSVPLSLFSHLFNSPSNMIPLGYYSTSADTISFNFEVASVMTALVANGLDRPDMLPPDMSFAIIDPEISFSKVQISNTAVLASIESLFRGVAAVPVAPGINVPLAFVMKFINYGTAISRVASSRGYFNVSIPANQPSMRAIAVRFCSEGVVNSGLYTGNLPQTSEFPVGIVGDTVPPYWTGLRYDGCGVGWGTTRGGLPAKANGSSQATQSLTTLNMVPGSAAWRRYSAGDGQWGGRYLFGGVQPNLRNLILRIASFRIPLDPLLDRSFQQDRALPGVPGLNPLRPAAFPGSGYPSGIPTDGLPLGTQGPFLNVYGSPIDLTISRRAALRLYQQAKHLFSPFADHEDPTDAPLTPLYMNGCREDSAQGILFQGSTFIGPRPGDDSVAGGAHPMIAVNASRVLCGGGQFRDRRAILIAKQGIGANAQTQVTTQAVGPTPITSQGAARARTPYPYWAGVNLLMLPFESIGAVYNHRDDAFALRGLDLRSITSMELTGEIVGTAPPLGVGMPAAAQSGMWNDYGSATTSSGTAVTGPASYGTAAYHVGTGEDKDILGQTPMTTTGSRGDGLVASSWTVRVISAFDQEHVLLPGRVDTEAQFSLIPTGATAIPSGGAPAF